MNRVLRLLTGLEQPDTGRVAHGHGLRLGYYAQEHETLDSERTVLENMRSAAPEASDGELRGILGSFLFPGDAVAKPAAVLSGGEKTRLALADQQPGPGEQGRDPECAAPVPGRDRAGHPRRGGGGGAVARAGDPAAGRRRGLLERGAGRSGGPRLNGRSAGPGP